MHEQLHTTINYGKLIEMQAKQNKTVISKEMSKKANSKGKTNVLSMRNSVNRHK